MDFDLISKLDKIHPYPAKFPVSFALDCIEKYSNPNDLIFDPFVGSGTTLLASACLNRKALGTDVNHVAVLISNFKLTSLDDEDFLILKDFIENLQAQAKENFKGVEKYYYPSIEHWFKEDVILALSGIKNAVSKIKNDKVQIFCKTVFSSIINSVSNQDSDTRYAAVEKPNVNYEYVISLFVKRFNFALNLFLEIKALGGIRNSNKAVLLNSKLCGNVVEENSVDLILTSPPYLNTYDYYLYHKHRMNWLELDVKFSMYEEIGSRREFSSLRAPKEKFNRDIFEVLEASNKVLKKDGTVILVIGDGKVRGEKYDAKEELISICSELNWRLSDYSYTLLDETSRSFQQSYRTKGKKEHVLVFTRGK